jgi:peptidoglycan-associated lipoprotein
MKVSKIVVSLALITTAALTGCSSTDEQHLDLSHGGQPGIIDASTSAYNRKDINGLNGVNSKGNINSTSSTGLNSAQSNINNSNLSTISHTIYFLYDSSDVEPSFLPLIEKQSQELLSNSDYTLILEGHADERGSREYNIALGEE